MLSTKSTYQVVYYLRTTQTEHITLVTIPKGEFIYNAIVTAFCQESTDSLIDAIIQYFHLKINKIFLSPEGYRKDYAINFFKNIPEQMCPVPKSKLVFTDYYLLIQSLYGQLILESVFFIKIIKTTQKY